jgi:hypothetical protein
MRREYTKRIVREVGVDIPCQLVLGLQLVVVEILGHTHVFFALLRDKLASKLRWPLGACARFQRTLAYFRVDYNMHAY